MARNLKPLKVDEIKDTKSGLVVEIFYDRNPGRHPHFASVGDERFEDIEIGKVKAWVHETLPKLAQFVWMPIIIVSDMKPSVSKADWPYNARMQLDIKRTYIAKRPQGPGYREVAWDVAEADRATRNSEFRWDETRRGPFEPPCIYSGDGWSDRTTSYYFPYTEATWGEFMAIIESFKGLRGLVAALVANPEQIPAFSQLFFEFIGAAQTNLRLAIMDPHN